MANTPNFTLRVAPEHRDLVRAVVARFKSDTGFADRLAAFLADTAAVAPPDALAALQARLEAVEARLASPPAKSDAARNSTSSPAREAATEPAQADRDVDALGARPAGGEEQQAPQAGSSPDTPPTSKPKRTKITPELRAEILRLSAEGKPGREVARLTGTSQPTVSRLTAADKGKTARASKDSAE